MNTNFLKTFTNSETFNIVRTFGTPTQPLFSGKDVAKCLGYEDTTQAIRKNVDEEDRFVLSSIGGISQTGQPQGHSVLINESGLFSLILRSRKEEAVKFKRWVTSEVLPSLRKNGTYSIIDEENLKRIKIENFQTVANILISLGLDDRDYLLIKDNCRGFIEPNEGKQQENTECSISKRLLDEFNYSKNNHKLLNQIGRGLANVFRKE